MRRRKYIPLRVASRESRLGGLKLHLLAIVAFLLAGLLFYVNRHPIHFGGPDGQEASGQPMPPPGEGDVLLLLPSSESAREASSFEAIDWSSNWYNILTQEFGVFRALDRGRITRDEIGEANLVVIPASVSRNMSAGEVATLEPFVLSGGRLLVELPTGVFETLVGVTVDPASYRSSRRITAFDGAVVRGELRDDVIQVPLRTILAPLEVAQISGRQEFEVILEVDGLPAYLRRTLGDGEVYALFFDLARAVAAIQQGVPAVDWEIARPSVVLPAGYTRTASLLVDPRIRRAGAPYADLLERSILQVITARHPMGRVWLFPNSAPGALVMTHSAIPTLAIGEYLTRWEEENRRPSTVFRSMETARQTAPLRSREGLLLIPEEAPYVPVAPIGLWRFTPLGERLNLQQQVEWMRQETSLPLMSRLSEGLWRSEYGQSFRILSALGVDVDSSYGPAFHATDLEATDGYCFGTGLPFFPVDRNGLLLDVMEVPVVLHDGTTLNESWVEGILQKAGRQHNELVLADWRTGTMSNVPRASVVSIWRSLFQQATSLGLWITDLTGFVEFWRLRSQVQLHSSFLTAERRLSIWVNVPAATDPLGATIRPSLAFEARYEGRSLERITLDGQDIAFSQLERSGDGVLAIVSLPEGSSRIEVIYQGPIELPP
ncbi:MAG: hypothetical protein JW797_18200 [Bradymonadales bacterium]|nr:hypothetical protein [Bradymonadales bacterium]